MDLTRSNIRIAVTIFCKDEVFESPRERHSYLVGGNEEVADVALVDTFRGRPRPQPQASGKSLHARVCKRRTSQNSVAKSVIERTDASASQITLDRHRASLALCDFPKFPSLSMQEHKLPINTVFLKSQRIQFLPATLDDPQRDVTHQVETETVNTMFSRPKQHSVDNKPLHHFAFRSSVVHARRTFIFPTLAAAVIVARNALVKDALALASTLKSVVEDNINDHTKTLGMQAVNHHTMLEDTPHSMWHGGIGTLGHHVQHGVVAPIVGVGVGDLCDGRLLVLGIFGCVWNFWLDSICSHFRHGPELERREQLNVCDSRVCQLAQVLVTIRAFFTESKVLSFEFLWHGFVVGAEVANVQFVDYRRFATRQGWHRQRLPSLDVSRGHSFQQHLHTADKAPTSVSRAHGGVWVRRFRGYELSFSGMVRFHEVRVVSAIPVHRALRSPHAFLVFATHWSPLQLF
mmetsp:Transcript_28412/g.75007  ORF Transcript_28412/g.75007 Transcript_28412/m.75007 type:complete len:461 (-) Transcript_28412:9-1391(-)